MLPQIDVDSSTSNLVAHSEYGTDPPAAPTSMMRDPARAVANASDNVASLPTRSNVASTPRPGSGR